MNYNNEVWCHQLLFSPFYLYQNTILHFSIMSIALQAIPSDIPVILDSKRGDIDTTAQAYATSSFEIFNASAVTLSPYMGWDSVQPFVTGAFVSMAYVNSHTRILLHFRQIWDCICDSSDNE